METATVVVLVSAYREGPLVEAALASALEATPHVLVFEGRAGDRLKAEVPETDYRPWVARGVNVRHGGWRTDAAKRTAMVKACGRFKPPVWALWLDGDELLKNPEALGDWCRYWAWQDEQDRLADPEAAPAMGWPIRLVELDGSVALCRGKVVRVDLIDRYDVSSSVFRNVMGFTHGEGNLPERLHENDTGDGGPPKPGFGQKLLLATELDRMIVPSWLVAEPYLVHRSLLRHPLRQGLRMHVQEAAEIERAKALEGVQKLNGQD